MKRDEVTKMRKLGGCTYFVSKSQELVQHHEHFNFMYRKNVAVTKIKCNIFELPQKASCLYLRFWHIWCFRRQTYIRLGMRIVRRHTLRHLHSGSPSGTRLPRCALQNNRTFLLLTFLFVIFNVVKSFWQKAASHVVPLLKIEWSLSLHAVIDDEMIFCNTRFHGPARVTAPQTASRSIQPSLQCSRTWLTDRLTDNTTPSVARGRITAMRPKINIQKGRNEGSKQSEHISPSNNHRTPQCTAAADDVRRCPKRRIFSFCLKAFSVRLLCAGLNGDRIRR